MKHLLSLFAGVGLLLTGTVATVAPVEAQAQSRNYDRDHRDSPRADRRYRDDRRYREARRERNSRRYREARRGHDSRRYRDDRRGVRERIISPTSREARAAGVQYRGPCRYVIRNGRRVCG